MKEDEKTVVKRRLERIYNLMECKSNIEYQDFPENRELFIYAFKHVKTDKID